MFNGKEYLKIATFWDIAPCSPPCNSLEQCVTSIFGMLPAARRFLAVLIFYPEDRGNKFL
jgi:hypothetical protein